MMFLIQVIIAVPVEEDNLILLEKKGNICYDKKTK